MAWNGWRAQVFLFQWVRSRRWAENIMPGNITPSLRVSRVYTMTLVLSGAVGSWEFPHAGVVRSRPRPHHHQTKPIQQAHFCVSVYHTDTALMPYELTDSIISLTKYLWPDSLVSEEYREWHEYILFRDISGYRIVGSPRCIDDKKYARNAFIFNFVFVFTSSTCTTAYEPIITKVGDTFRTCEVRNTRYFMQEAQHDRYVACSCK